MGNCMGLMAKDKEAYSMEQRHPNASRADRYRENDDDGFVERAGDGHQGEE